MKKEEREIDFWSCDDADENLTFDNEWEAIAEHVEQDCEWPIEEGVTTTVYGYVRTKATYDADRMLRDLLYELDEEYGGQDDTKPTEKMKKAAKEFVDVILSEYTPWLCENVAEKEITVDELIIKY